METGRRFFSEQRGIEKHQGAFEKIDVHPGLGWKHGSNKALSYTLWGVVIILAIVVLGGGAVYLFKPEWLPWSASPVDKERAVASQGSKERSEQGKKSGYVAVFLINNQVYFGKISGLNSQYPVLKDVYYLRTQRSLVPPDEVDSSPGARLRVERKRGTATPQQNERLTLLKLGNEIHGPVDEIKINRDHILYVEEIKEDSKVYQAIVKFNSQRE